MINIPIKGSLRVLGVIAAFLCLAVYWRGTWDVSYAGKYSEALGQRMNWLLVQSYHRQVKPDISRVLGDVKIIKISQDSAVFIRRGLVCTINDYAGQRIVIRIGRPELFIRTIRVQQDGAIRSSVTRTSHPFLKSLRQQGVNARWTTCY